MGCLAMPAEMSAPRCAPLVAARVRAALVCTALLCTACGGGIAAMPPIAVHPTDEAGVLDAAALRARVERLVATARAHGYHVAPLQPTRARFGVRTHYTDRHASELSEYRIAVECLPAGGCLITPLGPRVEMVHGEWHVPEGLRLELLTFELLMQYAAAGR